MSFSVASETIVATKSTVDWMTALPEEILEVEFTNLVFGKWSSKRTCHPLP